jgi:pimeloyl-ACP methyl ester carboxylesterase
VTPSPPRAPSPAPPARAPSRRSPDLAERVVFRGPDASILADRHAILAHDRIPAFSRRVAQGNNVWLRDLPQPVVAALVGYLESGDAPIPTEVSEPLRRYAEEHGLLELKQRCEHVRHRRDLIAAMASTLTQKLVRPFVQLIAKGERTLLRTKGFESRFVATSGGRLHLLDAAGQGTLPTLVVLHGLGSAATDFTLVLPKLARECRRVIAPDLPGHGRSDRPAAGLDARSIVAGLAEALDQVLERGERVVLVGNSLGGLAATLLAAKYPERVAGLFLSSPAGATMSERELRALLETFELGSHQEALTFVERLFARPPFPRLRPLLAAGARALLGAPEIKELLASARARDMLRPEQVRTLRMPVALSWGKRDRILPREQLEFWRSNLPTQANVIEPEELGHFPVFDDPERLSRDVLSFARTVKAGRP